MASLISSFFCVFTFIGLWSGSLNKTSAENSDRGWQKELIQYSADVEINKYKVQKQLDYYYKLDLKEAGIEE